MDKWKQKLNSVELLHLKGSAYVTLSEIKELLANMKEQRDAGDEPCWTCRSIAEKLNEPI